MNLSTNQYEAHDIINMTGANGIGTNKFNSNTITKPAQYQDQIKWININNTTDNTVNIYPAYVTDITTAYPVFQIGARMSISLNIVQQLANGMIFYFTNPSPSTYSQTKQIQITWTDESLGWSQSFAPSYSVGSSGSSSVSVVNIPAVNINSPLANGHVAVEVVNTPNVISQYSDYTNIFLTNNAANVATNMTAGASTGKSYYITNISFTILGAAVGASDVNITLKDGASAIWQWGIPSASIKGTNGNFTFPIPLKITNGNSVTLAIDTPNNAGCIVRSNMGGFLL